MDSSVRFAFNHHLLITRSTCCECARAPGINLNLDRQQLAGFYTRLTPSATRSSFAEVRLKYARDVYATSSVSSPNVSFAGKFTASAYIYCPL